MLKPDTVCRNKRKRSSDQDSEWQQTSGADLIHCTPPKTYFARFQVKGKLIRRRPNIKTFSLAKIAQADLDKSERKKFFFPAAKTNFLPAGRRPTGTRIGCAGETFSVGAARDDLRNGHGR
jgi:hypothetical protein